MGPESSAVISDGGVNAHPAEGPTRARAGEGLLYGKPEAPALSLRPGAAIYIGPDEPHCVVNSGRTPLQVLVSTPLAAEPATTAPQQLTLGLDTGQGGASLLPLLVVFDG